MNSFFAHSGHLCTNLCPCLMENGRSLRFGINSTQTWTDNGDKRYIFGEQSIAAARASVMIYDDNTKKWIPSGSSSGLSKVHIYQHLINNTFRVVGRKLQDHEVVINCSILKGLKYNQATQTFHQWRDNKQVYGLNFSSKEDADAFATAMRSAVDLLNNSGCRVPAAPTPQPSVYPTYQHLNGPCGDYEDIDIQQRMRSLPREDYSVMERRITSSSSGTNQSLSGPPTPASVLPVSGHHRTSSAPPAPSPAPSVNVPAAPPPPPAPPAPAPALALAPPAPAPAPPPPTGMLMSSSSASSLSAAPHMMMMSAPPPPPPPPAPNSNSLSRSNSSETANTAPGSLATALASAKLRKTSRGSESDNTYGTMRLGSSGERSQMGGMASMMDEMAKTLARRRAAAEHTTNPESDGHTTPEGKKGWDKSNGSNKYGSSNGAESPKPGRRQRFGSVSGSDEFKVNGGIDASDLERLKAEILSEFRNEINNLKQEILQAIRLNRR